MQISPGRTAVAARLASLAPTRAFLAAAIFFAAAVPLRAQQTIGPVTLSAGAGLAYQHRAQFTSLGANGWVGAETVLDRRVRVRLDFGYNRFGYASPPLVPCAPTSYCAPAVTSPLQVGAITGTIIWRDTTGVRRWYWLGGIGAYSAFGGRDANSRLGLTGGIGREIGATRSFFIEGRFHLPYDGNGYGLFIPVIAGWNFGHFVP